MILFVLNYISAFLLIVLATLSIACGLYYLSEVVEEYTAPTKRVIKHAIQLVLILHVLLFLVDGMPALLVGTGVAAHLCYYGMLNTFPFTALTSPIFLISTAMLVVHHYIVFNHFSSTWYEFGEIVAFFTLCVWMIPFTFFVSLSSADGLLPTSSTDDLTSSTGGRSANENAPHRKKGGMLRSTFDRLLAHKERFFPSRDQHLL